MTDNSITLLIGSLSLIFIILNYIKLREPALQLDIKQGTSPHTINVWIENLSDKFIHNLKISWEFYLEEGYKVTGGTLMSEAVLIPRKTDVRQIYVSEFLDPDTDS